MAAYGNPTQPGGTVWTKVCMLRVVMIDHLWLSNAARRDSVDKGVVLCCCVG